MQTMNDTSTPYKQQMLYQIQEHVYRECGPGMWTQNLEDRIFECIDAVYETGRHEGYDKGCEETIDEMLQKDFYDAS